MKIMPVLRFVVVRIDPVISSFILLMLTVHSDDQMTLPTSARRNITRQQIRRTDNLQSDGGRSQ
jgi:hypothetical protein